MQSCQGVGGSLGGGSHPSGKLPWPFLPALHQACRPRDAFEAYDAHSFRGSSV